MPILMMKNLGFQTKPLKVSRTICTFNLVSQLYTNQLFCNWFRFGIELLCRCGSRIWAFARTFPFVRSRGHYVPILPIRRWKFFAAFGRHYRNPSHLRYFVLGKFGKTICWYYWNFPVLTGSRNEGRVTNPALRPSTTTTPSPRITGKPEIPTKPTQPTKKPVHPPKPHPRPPHGGRKPSTCDTTYDAISIIRRELFIFKDRVNFLVCFYYDIKRFY